MLLQPMYTSHYGPRQGIYQPMESFRSSDWRSQYLMLQQLYQYKANSRMSMPPNSFPARSLVKRPTISSCTLLPWSETPPPPRAKARSAPQRDVQDCFLSGPDSLPPRISPSLKPNHYLFHKESKSSVKTPVPRCPSKSSPVYSSSFTSAPARIHPHPAKSTPQLPQRKNRPTFPYSDPIKTKEKRFTSRLVHLAKLECETVKQEALGHWTCQVPPTISSSSSMPTSTSSASSNGSKAGSINIGGSAKTLHSSNNPGMAATRRIPREARSKSAKTKAEVESEAKHRTGNRRKHKPFSSVKSAGSVHRAHRCPMTAATYTEECTQSMVDLQTLSLSEADLQGFGLGSLSLMGVELMEGGNTEQNKPKDRRECFMPVSASSCKLKAHKSSLKRTITKINE